MKFRIAAFADEASSSLDGQIRNMKENGVTLLEIRGVDGENISDISLSKASEVRERLDEAGIGVWSLGSPYGKISLEDDFDAHLRKFEHGLKLCEVLGAKHIRLFSFYGSEGKTDEVFKRLERFLDSSKGSGIILCHENEKGIYGEKAPKCLEIHRQFPDIRAVFDPANFIQAGQDTLKAWEMLRPFIEYMHIKDALPDGSVVPAGKGTGNLPFLLSEYDGDVVTVEPHLTVFGGLSELEREKKSRQTYAYPDQETAFKAAVDALKALI